MANYRLKRIVKLVAVETQVGWVDRLELECGHLIPVPRDWSGEHRYGYRARCRRCAGT